MAWCDFYFNPIFPARGETDRSSCGCSGPHLLLESIVESNIAATATTRFARCTLLHTAYETFFQSNSVGRMDVRPSSVHLLECRVVFLARNSRSNKKWSDETCFRFTCLAYVWCGVMSPGHSVRCGLTFATPELQLRCCVRMLVQYFLGNFH